MAPQELSVASALFRICFVLATVQFVVATQPFVVPWSTTKFGPDGPWQAVNIIVGGNDSSMYISAQMVASLAVYPGGEFQSLSYTDAACANFPNSLCGVGGTWNPDPFQANQQRISFSPSFVDNTTGLKTMGARSIALGLTINEKSVWNATLASATSGNITYPNGVVGGVPLGNLALGAGSGAPEQFFSLSNTEVGRGINASIFPGRLSRDGDIPSYSYGLHIGSAALDYPGSLVFGGYNKGRVIEPVTSFEDANSVELLDIGIGVEYGDSPFSFKSKDKLLPSQMKVKPDPLSPYLSLPRQTCETLAGLLPVTFDQSLKYYVWNKDDPNFAKIVSSPAYLSFTFPPSNGKSDNIIIKVPFTLLNLTLGSPITKTPTQYFPCMPYDGVPVLGRAFLQAAFIGRNWEKQIGWLAQAPGPGVSRRGLGDQNMDIPKGAVTIEGWSDPNLFNASWKGHWSIITSQNTAPTPAPPQTSDVQQAPQPGDAGSGNTLSTGAKAGIGVGAAVGAIVLFGALGFIWHKRATKKTSTTVYESPIPGAPKPPHEYYRGQPVWMEDSPVSEIYSAAPISPVEIADTSSAFRR